jgi:hypothetical protein
VYNWFDKVWIAMVFGALQLFKTAGYMTWLEFSQTELTFLKTGACGVAMIIFGVIDYCTFIFYPLEADIFIEVEGRSKEDRQFFDQCLIEVQN